MIDMQFALQTFIEKDCVTAQGIIMQISWHYANFMWRTTCYGHMLLQVD